MFRESYTNICITLKTFLTSSSNFEFNSGFGKGGTLGGTQLYVRDKSKKNYTLIIRDIQDFNDGAFNLLNLCHIWNNCQDMDTAMGVATLIDCFLSKLENCSEQEKEPYLKQFFGDIHYKDLTKINRTVAEGLMRALLNIDPYASKNKLTCKGGLSHPPLILLEYSPNLEEGLVEATEVRNDAPGTYKRMM